MDRFVWERERYYNRNDWGIIVVDNMSKEERDWSEELRSGDRDVQKQEEESKMRETKYNKEYKDIYRDKWKASHSWRK